MNRSNKLALALVLTVGLGLVLLKLNLHQSIIPISSNVPTGITKNWLTYTDDDYSFTFKYPPEYFIRVIDRDTHSISVQSKTDLNYPTGTLAAFDILFGVPINDYIQLSKPLVISDLSINGVTFKKTVRPNNGGVQFKNSRNLYPNGGAVNYFTAISKDDLLTFMGDTRILSTLKFSNPISK
jgi:hypothetical protein